MQGNINGKFYAGDTVQKTKQCARFKVFDAFKPLSKKVSVYADSLKPVKAVPYSGPQGRKGTGLSVCSSG